MGKIVLTCFTKMFFFYLQEQEPAVHVSVEEGEVEHTVGFRCPSAAAMSMVTDSPSTMDTLAENPSARVVSSGTRCLLMETIFPASP